MVDRLEELLAMLEDEDGGEEAEDLPEQAGTALPLPPPQESGTGEARESEIESGPGADRARSLPAEPEAAPAQDGPAELRTAERAGETARWDSLTDEGQGGAGRDLPEAGERRDLPAAGAEDWPGVRGDTAARGLERLYRETVRAAGPVLQPQPPERAGDIRSSAGPGRAAELTVDELDRAVRRDSRRYDGGMTLF